MLMQKQLLFTGRALAIDIKKNVELKSRNGTSFIPVSIASLMYRIFCISACCDGCTA